MKSIELQNVTKVYPAETKPAIKDISLGIEEGEFFSLVGPSGCGKTTVLKVIVGLEKPTEGNVVAPEHISMVFQSGALLPWLTVEENTAFGLKMVGEGKEKINRLTHEYLEMVKLSGFAKKYPRELSGGQRQRVGIARALAMEPQVLLLDEPFSALDPLTTEELHEDLLKIWQQTKITIVMVSHLVEEAVFLSDRIGVMTGGSLKNIIEVSLKRSRNVYDKDFRAMSDKIRAVLK